MQASQHENESQRVSVGLHRSRSHWFETAGTYSASPPLYGDQHADVCIIGAGISGCSAAYHLKTIAPNASVALLEAEVAGFGASGRNAGQLIVAFGRGNFKHQLRKYGARNIADAWNYVAEGIRLIEKFGVDERIEFDYAPTGTLQVSIRGPGESKLDDYQSFLETIGQDRGQKYLSSDQVAEEFRNSYFGAGLFDSRGGQFNPLKLVRGLKVAAERRGARVYENSPVATIDRTGKSIVVRTGAGSIRCSKLVLATNAYTHLLDGLHEIKGERLQTPLLVHASATAPLTKHQWDAVGWPRRCGVNVMSDLFYSFGPTIDGRIVYVGGYYLEAPDTKGLGPEVSIPFLRTGHAHLETFFPTLKGGLHTAQSWGGPISATADSIPHVGLSSDPRIVYSCGCWGHGMPIGMHNGRTMAELAIDRQTESSGLWFVKRSKRMWPNRFITTYAANRVAALRRINSRRIGSKLTPPLRFDATQKDTD